MFRLCMLIALVSVTGCQGLQDMGDWAATDPQVPQQIEAGIGQLLTGNWSGALLTFGGLLLTGAAIAVGVKKVRKVPQEKA